MSARVIPLGKIAKLERDGIDPQTVAPSTKYVGLEHIGSDGSIASAPTVAPGDLASTKFCFDQRHILFGKLRPYLRKVARPDFAGICSTDIIPIAPSKSVDRDYLYHFLRTDRVIALATSLASGANLPRISPKLLAEFEVPLPSLSEQRRIAGILDEADKLRSARHKTVKLLGRLTMAQFHRLFGAPLSRAIIGIDNGTTAVPAGWRWRRLQDVAEMRTGHTPSRKINRYWDGGKIPWLTLGDIRKLDGKVVFDTIEHVTEAGIDNSSAVLLPKSTVCFARTASVGFVTIAGTPISTSQDFVNWICGPSLDPFFLMWAFISARKNLRALAPGSTHHTIYFRLFEVLHIAVPPMSLQKAFRSLAEEARSMQSQCELQADKLTALLSSLRREYFPCAESNPETIVASEYEVAAE